MHGGSMHGSMGALYQTVSVGTSTAGRCGTWPSLIAEDAHTRVHGHGVRASRRCSGPSWGTGDGAMTVPPRRRACDVKCAGCRAVWRGGRRPVCLWLCFSVSFSVQLVCSHFALGNIGIMVWLVRTCPERHYRRMPVHSACACTAPGRFFSSQRVSTPLMLGNWHSVSCLEEEEGERELHGSDYNHHYFSPRSPAIPLFYIYYPVYTTHSGPM
jgi:hypothetical protein